LYILQRVNHGESAAGKREIEAKFLTLFVRDFKAIAKSFSRHRVQTVTTQASVDRECPTCLQRHLSNILNFF